MFGYLFDGDWVACGMIDVLVQIKEAFTILSNVVVIIVSWILSLVGISLSPAIIQLIAIGIILFSFWKWLHHMPLLILIILGLVLASLLTGLFSSV